MQLHPVSGTCTERLCHPGHYYIHILTRILPHIQARSGFQSNRPNSGIALNPSYCYIPNDGLMNMAQYMLVTFVDSQFGNSVFKVVDKETADLTESLIF